MEAPHRHIINSQIVADNEAAARSAYHREDYISCLLLVHALVESLLRAFLGKPKDESFNGLIKSYEAFLQQEGQPEATLCKELTEFNRRRNRVVHGFWKEGYTATNGRLEPACQAAFMVYGLLIEWLETFDPEITEFGFHYE